MSPEQARGENDAIDERSDVYSATVVFQELICLKHYLNDKASLEDMIRGVIEDPFRMGDFMISAGNGQGPQPPYELLWFVSRGMEKKPGDRFPSARAMINRLEDTLDGRVHVQCPVTLTKRVTGEMGHFVDRHPFLAVGTFFGAVIGVVAALVVAVRAVL